MADEACRGCGGRFAAMAGDRHDYMLASPGCWTAYGMVLAREYEDPRLFAACHRLTVDAYAVQHPGDGTDPRGPRSARLHAASLAAIFGEGASHGEATALLKRLAADRSPVPAPPRIAWRVTLADVASAAPADHLAAVTRWARSTHEDLAGA